MIVDCFQAGAVTSMVIVELIWICALFLLVLSEAHYFCSCAMGSMGFNRCRYSALQFI